MSTAAVRGRDEVIFGGGSKGAGKAKDPAPTPEIQAAVEALDMYSTSDDYKSVGNLCFAHRMFSAAIKHYSSALEKDPASPEVLHSNRSAAYLQSILVAGPGLALKDAQKAIAIKPDWFKGHLRLADAHFAKKEFNAAIAAYEKALQLNPACDTARESLSRCQAMQTYEEQSAKSPEKAPYQEEAHGQNPSPSRQHPAGKPQPPPEEERIDTDTLIETWSKESAAEEGKTAFKKYKGSVEEADREQGQATKNAWMNSFRKKVGTDESFKDNLEQKLESEKLSGDGFNYRGEVPKGQYAKGTDAVGNAITTDAYKSHKYMSTAW